MCNNFKCSLIAIQCKNTVQWCVQCVGLALYIVPGSTLFIAFPVRCWWWGLDTQNAGIKVYSSGWRLAAVPPKQIAFCCVDWGPLRTKVCFSRGARGPCTRPCTLRPASGERGGSVSGQGPLQRWKDNLSPPATPPCPPPVSLDLMRRQTICERWHGQIGPKGYEWETSKPAHVSANVKGFV